MVKIKEVLNAKTMNVFATGKKDKAAWNQNFSFFDLAYMVL